MKNNPLAEQLMLASQMNSPLLTQAMAPLQAPQMIRPQVPFVPQTPGIGPDPASASGTMNPLFANKIFSFLLGSRATAWPFWGVGQ